MLTLWKVLTLGKNHLIERIETRHGNHIIDASYKLNFGYCEYDLINID